MVRTSGLIRVTHIERRIFLVRGHKVILDADLAELYGVTTKRLNEQIKRNLGRFPPDFMFRLSRADRDELMRSQFATASKRNIRYAPYAFTEHGAIMAANVLNSHRAVEMSVLVVRAFVRLRQLLSINREVAGKLAELERRVGTHDNSILELMASIRQLMEPPSEGPRERIGFHR